MHFHLVASLAALIVVSGTAPAQGVPIVEAVGEDTVSVRFTGNAADFDHEVLFSSDLVNWESSNLFVPAGRTLAFSFPKPSNENGFFALGEALPGFPLDAALLSVGGTTFDAGLGKPSYTFRSDGTGVEYFDLGDFGIEAYHFNWTEESEPGMTTVSLEFVDTWEEMLNIQLLPGASPLGEDQYYYVRSLHDRSIRYASLEAGPLEIVDPPASFPGGAPGTLTGTQWRFVQTGGELPVDFQSATSAAGPAVQGGAPTTWDYVYFKSGSNTGVIHLTDAAGDFLRILIDFNPDGASGNFFASPSLQDPIVSSLQSGEFLRE